MLIEIDSEVVCVNWSVKAFIRKIVKRSVATSNNNNYKVYLVHLMEIVSWVTMNLIAC